MIKRFFNSISEKWLSLTTGGKILTVSILALFFYLGTKNKAKTEISSEQYAKQELPEQNKQDDLLAKGTLKEWKKASYKEKEDACFMALVVVLKSENKKYEDEDIRRGTKPLIACMDETAKGGETNDYLKISESIGLCYVILTNK